MWPHVVECRTWTFALSDPDGLLVRVGWPSRLFT